MPDSATVGIVKQVYACGAACILVLSYGTSVGWMSPMYYEMDEGSTKAGHCTDFDLSLIGATICFGGAVGSLIMGPIGNCIGRKWALWSLGFVQIASWLFIEWGHSYLFLLAARALAGLAGGGAFVLIPIFIREVCEQKVRHHMSWLIMIVTNIGIVWMFAVGFWLSYDYHPRIFVTVPMIFLGAFLLVPDTPYFHLKNQKPDKARSSLQFYRGASCKEDTNCPGFRTEYGNVERMVKGDNEMPFRCDDLCSRVGLLALLLLTILTFVNIYCGLFTIITYATYTLFHGGVGHTTRNGLFIGIALLVGSIISALMVNRIKRKTLYGISGIGMGVGLGIFGVSVLVDWPISLRLISLMSAVYYGGMGLVALPFVFVPEIMCLPNCRVFTQRFVLVTAWVMGYIILLFYDILVANFQLHNVMFLFAGVSIFGVVFILCGVMETTERSAQDVYDQLSGNKK